jgi:hypothetical protein
MAMKNVFVAVWIVLALGRVPINAQIAVPT